MEKSDFHKLTEWFDHLLEMSQEARIQVLAELADSEPEMASQLQSMFADQTPADAFFADLDQQHPLAENPLQGQIIGGYSIGELLGSGGMGSVYRATLEGQSFKKDFALKILPGAGHSPLMRHRFLMERKILASLNHPHIAGLVDGGLHEAQTPFLVMDFIEGQTLLGYCQSHELGLRRRLELFMQVCEAVTYAHRQFVIHRDLKPENILVDGNGQAKLLDFGIARLQLHQDDVALTKTLHQALTPDYASPEQIRGERLTSATDIYSLGVVLYELLTQQKPYVLKGRSAAEIQDILSNTQPTKPSAMSLSTNESSDNTATNWHPKLKGELDTIVLKAMAKLPGDRYASVAAFAEDLRRYLGREPILAKQPTWAYLGWKFIQRYRTTVLLLSLVFFSLCAGLWSTYNQALRAAKAQRLAEREAEKSRQVSEFLVQLFEFGNPKVNQGEGVELKTVLQRGQQKFEADLDLNPEVRASLHGVFGRIFFHTGDYPAAERELTAFKAMQTTAQLNDSDDFKNSAYLAESYIYTGKFEDAQAQLTALELQASRAQRPMYQGIAQSLMGLAELRQSRPQVAKSHFEKAESILEPIQSKEASIELGLVLNNMGTLFLDAHELDQAEIYLQKAADLLKDHPMEEVAIRTNLAVIHTRTGQLDKAIAANREVIQLKQKIHGKDTALLASNYQNLGHAYLQKNDLDQAETAFKTASQLYASQEPTMYHAFPMVGLSKTRLMQKRYEDALALGEQGLTLLAKYQPPESHLLANIRLHLSTCHFEMGQYDRGAKLALAALEPLVKTLGKEHPLSTKAVTLLNNYADTEIRSKTRQDIQVALQPYQ